MHAMLTGTPLIYMLLGFLMGLDTAIGYSLYKQLSNGDEHEKFEL